jgi:signal transduction histidine kinase
VAAPGVEGKVHHFEVGLVPSAGAGAAYYGIAQDVTESRALAREVAERTTELLTTREERQRLQEFVSLVMQAQEDERSRIASDLHDTTVQTLTAIGRRLQSLADDPGRDSEVVRSELAELAAAALNEADEVRRLSRNLRPSVLDHLGLAPALQNLVAEVRQGGLDVAIEVKGEAGRLDKRVRTTLFRIAQEALTNVRRHSEASHVAVWLRVGEAEVALTVEDDGRGFDVATTRQPGAGIHMGLAGMGERCAIMGGTLTVVSGPNSGTRVTARIPLDV